jgi:hypothetical protein
VDHAHGRSLDGLTPRARNYIFTEPSTWFLSNLLDVLFYVQASQRRTLECRDRTSIIRMQFQAEVVMLSDDQIAAIRVLLRSASKDAIVTEDELREQLEGLLQWAGLSGPHPVGAIATQANSVARVDHAAMATLFQSIAIARDPVVTYQSLKHGFAVLNAAIRRRERAMRPRTDVRTIEAARFDIDPSFLRQQAQLLARIQRQLVGPGRPQKDVIDVVLEQLGEGYARLIGFAGDPRMLPYSRTSRFVRFCRIVIRPYFRESETTLRAISNRLDRLNGRSRSRRRAQKNPRRTKR